MTCRSSDSAPGPAGATGAAGLVQAGWLNGASGAGPAAGGAPKAICPDDGAPCWTARRHAEGNSPEASGANCWPGRGQAGGSDSVGTGGGVHAGGGSVDAFVEKTGLDQSGVMSSGGSSARIGVRETGRAPTGEGAILTGPAKPAFGANPGCWGATLGGGPGGYAGVAAAPYIPALA
jgi:hypothetical protein